MSSSPFDDPKQSKPLVIPTVYQHRAVDAYLVYCDFLDVEYARTTFGLRKKRTKHPPYDPKSKHRANEIYLNEPLGSIKYWRLLPDSSWIELESKYECQVEDPFELLFDTIEKPHKHTFKFRRIPSLYQIANVAFPLRWIDRQGEWTQEQLMDLEYEEAKETAWWWKHGGGRTSGPT